MAINYITTRNETQLLRFVSVYQNANNTTNSRAVRKLVVGDSRYSYGGFGQDSNPLEAFKLWKLYGHSPETPLVQLISWGSASRGDGTAMWLIGSSNNLSSNATGTVRNSGTIPYMMEGNVPYLKYWDGITSTASFACQHKADSVHPSTGVIPASSFMEVTGGLRAEIFIAREPVNTPEIKYLTGYSNNAGLNYFPTTIANTVISTTGVTTVQGDIVSCSGAEGPIRSYLTSSYGSISPTGYAHCILGSNNVSGSVEHVGLLFRSAITKGMGISSWSAGGKKMGDFLNDRPNSYPTFNAYAPDIISPRFGYNDANAAHSPATFQADAQAFVDWVKTNVKGPDGVTPPLIEFESPYNQNAISPTDFDGYVAALTNVAAANDGVMLLDIRSASDASGFTPATDLADGIHANITGCIKVANIRYSLLNSLLHYVSTTSNLTVKYFDKATANFYALIFNSGNLAFNPNTYSFGSYSDSIVGSYAIGLVLDSNRNNFYSSGVPVTSGFVKDDYLVEIWQRTGSSPDKTNDYQKGVGTMSWDGNQENYDVGVPRLSEPSFIGQRTVTATGDLISFYVESFNEFGSLADTSNRPEYRFYKDGAALSPDITGSMTKINTGFYSTSRVLSSGTLIAPNNYEININGSINGLSLSTTKTLSMVSPMVVNPPDTLTILGYSSGYVTGSSPNASSFITTLPFTDNDYFNGAVARIRGQARIIYDCIGSTKRIYLNKSLTFTPSSGDYIILYPIGGELGVF